ncbi:Hint domain-containing protein [Celeribacter halophilus]|uniref:Hint domain-containing protein n=1 Tax=Celeribacter halophilus TaxID=576117 RepID=UPI001C08AD3C|nr:Hint domain-containing protein [Celeribacter halophilus]MBU2888223.1 Hint domain-containing protein [Celeribacter halophilus]MDO6512304.1 Hint domain-containing protein [Celeribacter halophilus]
MAFISEVNFRGSGAANSGEFVEITLGPGDDPADFVVSVYDDDGTLHTGAGLAEGEVNLGDLTTGITTHPDNDDYTIYTIKIGLRNAVSDANEGSGIALTNVDTDTVISFYSADNISAFTASEGAAEGATSESILEHTDVVDGESYHWDIFGNLTYETISSNDSALCLAGDTRVHTESGALQAQDLNVGDMVWTADHGFQPIQWLGKTVLSAEYLKTNPKQQPITLTKDSLAPGVPQSDLTVSRQHRVLISSPVAQRMTGKFEVLVPAVKLLDVVGIELSVPSDGVTLVHILFERHELIAAEGALVESLMVTDHVNSKIHGVDLGDRKIDVPARLIVDKKRAKQLVSRIVKNQRPLFEPRKRHNFRMLVA